MDTDAIKKELKKYNFDDLYLWFSIISIHPSNAKYGLRFDYLLALLLSIPINDFEGKKFGRKECCDFIAFYKNNTFEYFSSLEDYEPLSQLDTIPFFYNKQKYFFFYGTLEHPYECLKTFNELYCCSEIPQKERENIRTILECSLDFQTFLLKKILSIKESKNTSDDIIVPSNSYYNALYKYFFINKKYMKYFKDMLPLVSCSAGKPEDLFASIIECKFFDSLIVKSKNQDYFVWPSGHIEALFSLPKNMMSKMLSQEMLLNAKKNKLKRICTQFFTIKGIIQGVFSIATQNLIEDFDIVAVVDGSKLILFKVIGAEEEDNISEELYNLRHKVDEISEIINKDAMTGISYVTSKENIFGIPTKEVELFMIYVYQKETLADYIIKIENNELTDRDYIVELSNLEHVFENLSGPLNFIKFLRNEIKLFNQVNCFCIDYLDRFIYYIENKESYLSQGILPNYICFEPHSWSNYYHQHLKQKYQDNIHELLNRYFPNYFNKIKPIGNNRYMCMDTAFLDGGHVVKLEDDKIVLISLPPQGYFCKSFEIKTAEFITDLYSYYISKLEKNMKNIFKQLGICLPEMSMIVILPKSYVIRECIDYIIKDKTLFNENALSVRTGIVQNGTGIRTVIVYEPDKLENLFTSSSSIGERYFISKYLISLILFYCTAMSRYDVEATVEKFIEQNIPLNRKAFAFESHIVTNPKLDLYRKYDKIQDTDISQINQEVASFLLKSMIKPSRYEGDDALRILSSIYDYLEGNIEKELAQYNQNIIFYAYQQLEYVLGQERKLLQQSGFHLTKYVEFDVVGKALTERYEYHKSITSMKFIISSILKINTNGTKIINQEAWNRLHALASIIQTISIMYECVKFSVIPHYILINDQYEFEIISLNQIVNFEEFRHAETEEKIQFHKEKYFQKENQVSTKSDKPATKEYYEKLDSYFIKKHGFMVNDMITVLLALSQCNIENQVNWPLNILKEEEIINFLKTIITVCPSNNVLLKIIKFLSVDFNMYKNDRFFLFHLFKSENRFNLRPIIKLNTNEFCFGNQMCESSAMIWGGCIKNGYYVHECDNELNQIMDDYRRTLDKQIEKLAQKKCIEVLGKENVEANILNFKRLSKKFPSRPPCGEIDILVINRETKVIHIIDVKNRIRSFRPYDIAMEVKIFLTGNKSYLGKLIKKEKFIKHNIEEVLEYFKIKDYDGWTTQAAFIVSQVYPSAYYHKKAAEFIILDNIEKYLKS